MSLDLGLSIFAAALSSAVAYQAWLAPWPIQRIQSLRFWAVVDRIAPSFAERHGPKLTVVTRTESAESSTETVSDLPAWRPIAGCQDIYSA